MTYDFDNNEVKALLEQAIRSDATERLRFDQLASRVNAAIGLDAGLFAALVYLCDTKWLHAGSLRLDVALYYVCLAVAFMALTFSAAYLAIGGLGRVYPDMPTPDRWTKYLSDLKAVKPGVQDPLLAAENEILKGYCEQVRKRREINKKRSHSINVGYISAIVGGACLVVVAVCRGTFELFKLA